MRACFSAAVFCSLLAGLSATASPATARHPAPVIPTPGWLPSGAPARARLLQDLAPKAAQPPGDAIFRRLSFAQKQFLKPAPVDRRLGIDAAYDAALLAQIRASDPALTARIFDAFLLPFLRDAHPEAAYQTSRQSLLKAAFHRLSGKRAGRKGNPNADTPALLCGG